MATNLFVNIPRYEGAASLSFGGCFMAAIDSKAKRQTL
jgi:hypothetical protein